MRFYRFDLALLSEGWTRDVTIAVGSDGIISEIMAGKSSPGTVSNAVHIAGAAIPGMANGHSHAFQRIMAGFTEHATGGSDDFWSWRQLMYLLANRVTPEDLYSIASQGYVEMLKAGYTSVAEFHYLHDAKRDDGPIEMTDALIAATADSGIHLCLFPVLYQTSGFGGKAPLPEQERFILDTERYLKLMENYRKTSQKIVPGAAFHSLRAVPPEAIRETLAALETLMPGCPVHIHIAEQKAEVEACLAWSGKTPVRWLLDNAEVDARWSLIHATHMTPEETAALARTGAVAGLCPTTEANLGDGLFSLGEWLKYDGALSIGSDSHISVSVPEELRWLEYGQRLTLQKRAVATFPGNPHVGDHLYSRAVEGGAQSLGLKSGVIETGFRADIVVLDTSHPSLYGREGAALLDSYVFSGHGNPVSDVIVAGRHVVKNGVHAAETAIAARYRAAMDRLLFRH